MRGLCERHRLCCHRPAERGNGARRRVAPLTQPRFITVAETGSTNTDLLALVAMDAPLPPGAWLIANRQTQGRGRQGRVWRDGHGNFMGSTMVHLRVGDPPAHSLALLMGLCVIQALESAMVANPAPPLFQLKWPNDIVVNGAKIAGILLERQGDYVVIGVGVNLVVSPDVSEYHSTSCAALGLHCPRDDFAERLRDITVAAIEDWRDGRWPHAIIAQWMARAHPIGTPITLSEGGNAGLTGCFDGLERDGSLRLRLPDGSAKIIHAGEVRIG